MKPKLVGDQIDEAKRKVKLLARAQYEMERGGYDTVRAIIRDTDIKYPTAVAWLNSEKTRLLVLELSKRKKRS